MSPSPELDRAPAVSAAETTGIGGPAPSSLWDSEGGAAIARTDGHSVLTILCISTTVSYAQTTATADPLESMPFRFGPFGINPTLAVTNFGLDYNIFNASTDPQSDFTMTVTPRLQAGLRSGKVLLSGSLATGLVYYKDSTTNARSTTLPTAAPTSISAGFSRTRWPPASTRASVSMPSSMCAPPGRKPAGGGDALRDFAQDRRGARCAQVQLDFPDGTFFDGVPLSRTLNSETRTVEGGLELYLTPLTTFAVMALDQTDRFD